MTTAERLTAVAENVQKVYEAGKAAAGPGFVPPISEALDPDEVYRTTRPSSWPVMPKADANEIWLLCQCDEGEDDIFTAQIYYSGQLSIDFGWFDGETFEIWETASPVSGEAFLHTVSHRQADEYGNWWYFVRVKSTTMYNCRFAAPTAAKTAPSVVELVCSRFVSTLTIGSSSSAHAPCQRLRYIRFTGAGGVAGMADFAAHCGLLLAVCCEAENQPTNMTTAFYYCYSLCAVSDRFIAGNATGVSCYSAFSFTSFSPTHKTNLHANNLSYAFNNNRNTTIDLQSLNTESVTDFSNAFSNSSAEKITNLDISSAKTTSNMFYMCRRLKKLLFSGEAADGGITIDLSPCILNHKALVEMIDSLPVATAAATITITGNPGASELTDAEIAVATAKNWTITR